MIKVLATLLFVVTCGLTAVPAETQKPEVKKVEVASENQGVEENQPS